MSHAFSKPTRLSILAAVAFAVMPMVGQAEQCIPSCATNDARFLALAGTEVSTLAGDSIRVGFVVPASDPYLAIEVFDGDVLPAESGGLWDQVKKAKPVEYRYTLFADPLGNGTGTQVVDQWSSNEMANNDWYRLVLNPGDTVIANVPQAQASPGAPYLYSLLVENLDPGTFSINGFKIRVLNGGGLSLKAGQAYGIIGALATLPEAEIIYPHWPLLTDSTYDGVWEFHIEVPPFTTSLTVWDGDSDYGSADLAFNDTDDLDTPGYPFLPPWAVGTEALSEGVAWGLGGATGNPPDDNTGSSIFMRSPSVYYELISPEGVHYINANPSGNLEWERFRIATEPFDATKMDYHADSIPPGMWKVVGYGMDLSNLNAWRFETEVLSSVPLGDRVWVDGNKNGKQDPGESGVNGVRVDLFDCYGSVLKSTTTADKGGEAGYYLFDGLTPGGCYLVKFILPDGYGFTVLSPPGIGDPLTDSDADPTGLFRPIGTTPQITLEGTEADMGWDAGLVSTADPNPSMTIVKTVDKDSIEPYDMVTYSYKVTNTGNTILNDILVTDDNGTPDTASDDFTVGTIPILEPGNWVTLTAGVIPVVSTESIVNGSTVDAGAVIVVVQQTDGNIKVTYLQDFGINDNTYGTGAIGWPSGHTFGNLTGSDKLEFRFFDGNGNVVMDFYVDTITQAASTVANTGSPWSATYPAGYGTLGPFGGDGSWVSGNKANLLYYSTSITENLNQPLNVPKKASLIVNSPTSLVSGDVVVDPTKAPGGWDSINNYTVIIKGSAFGTAGFGRVEVPDQHNSPNKLGGPHGMVVVAKDSTVVNTAKAATASAAGGLTATATASVEILVPSNPVLCSLEMAVTKLDKKEFIVTIANKGPADAVLTGFALTWPSTNGKLMDIKLDADVVYTKDLPAPSASLTTAQLSAASSDAKRTIKKGESDALKMIFEKDVNKTLAKYTAGFTFGLCTLTLP